MDKSFTAKKVAANNNAFGLPSAGFCVADID